MGMRWNVGKKEYAYNNIIAQAGRTIGKKAEGGIVVIEYHEVGAFAHALRNKINDYTVEINSVNHCCFQLAKACNCLVDVLDIINGVKAEDIIFG